VANLAILPGSAGPQAAVVDMEAAEAGAAAAVAADKEEHATTVAKPAISRETAQMPTTDRVTAVVKKDTSPAIVPRSATETDASATHVERAAIFHVTAPKAEVVVDTAGVVVAVDVVAAVEPASTATKKVTLHGNAPMSGVMAAAIKTCVVTTAITWDTEPRTARLKLRSPSTGQKDGTACPEISHSG